jgi:hypothetical protein
MPRAGPAATAGVPGADEGEQGVPVAPSRSTWRFIKRVAQAADGAEGLAPGTPAGCRDGRRRDRRLRPAPSPTSALRSTPPRVDLVQCHHTPGAPTGAWAAQPF